MAMRALGGDAHHVGNIVIIGHGLSGKSFAPKDPLPPLD
jgi:hypothetical protein